jgi:aryl-alcohol dehydrogenase-like predicted oxidoreductase
MQYVKLGTTGLDVSPVAIGAMTYGEPDRGHPIWSLGEAEARPLIKHALDAGINFFDSANMYSQGSSEEILGRALRDFGHRDDLVIATKLRHPMRPGPNGKGLSRKAIMTEIDHSLRRLGTDYVDLYQIHRNDHTTPLAETLEALHDVVKAGKVRYLGASSMPAWEFAKALHLQRENGWARFVSMQDHYNLLARGRLARAWDDAKATSRSNNDDFADLLYPPTTERSDRATIEAVGRVAQARGVTRAQVALAWLRGKPVVTAPLVGASTVGQIDDAVASLDIVLTDEENRALEAHYTPRYDFQGVSDDADLQAIRDRIPGFALSWSRPSVRPTTAR